LVSSHASVCQPKDEQVEALSAILPCRFARLHKVAHRNDPAGRALPRVLDQKRTNHAEQSAASMTEQRVKMVDNQLRPFDVFQYDVLAAFLDIPRELFVPE
jgi:hypothetical protein